MAIAYADTPVLVASTPELDRQLNTDLPVLLYVWNGETIKTDLKNELDRVAREYSGRILVVKADTSRAPEIAEQFEVGRHPIMIGYLKGEQIGRRNRPWASDVAGMVDILEPHAPKPAAVPAPKKEEKPVAVDKPVKVSEATFEQEVINSPVPVLVDFWAEWCGPCKQIAPALEKLAKEFSGKVKIAKVNVDENPRLAQMFGVQGIPNLMFVKGGKIVGQQAGALPEHVLRNAINQLIALKL